MNKIFLLCMLSLMATACLNRDNNKNDAEIESLAIEKPVVPAMYSSPDERLEYLVMHYWDKYDFADTAYINVPEVTEQHFGEYMTFLQELPYDAAINALNKFLRLYEQDADVVAYFNELFEKYLYDEGSPVRNEELYIPVLRHIISSDYVEDIMKLRPQRQLKLALTNRIGEKATDFRFRMSNGKRMNLYDIKAEHTLLFIYNPDCNACAEIIDDLGLSKMLSSMVTDGRMKVVAVYPDEDLDAWRRNQSKIPTGWINGYDENLLMRNQDIYDIKAIPSLYLLDREKKVLVRDAAEAWQIEQYFRQL